MHWWRLRTVLNLANLSTPLGLLAAAAARCRLRRGPRGLVLATGYRLPVPPNPAFTIGDVVLTRRDEGFLESRPRLLAHEERHSWQYAACLGLPMVPLSLLAAGWSYLRGGDFAAHNPFERLAGLADGGYPHVDGRPVSARLRRRRAASATP